MLPLKNRIKKRKEFENVFQKGKSVLGLFFILKINKNNYSYPRFAFVFPIKYEKKAHKRNKAKRLFREIVRTIYPSIKEGIDIIFIIKKEVENRKYEEIGREIEKVFRKINLI